MTLQWIPSHCGVGGNEEADRLSKMGSKLEQSAQPMSYSEAKTILRNNFRTEWQQRLDIGTEDSIHQLHRAAQVTIFRLRNGHCQLLSHLHRLKIFHSDECPCGTGPQTPNHNHILQSCHTFNDLRRQTWPSPVEAHRKLWGPVETLRQTSPYSPDWKSSMAGNAEEEGKHCDWTVWVFRAANCYVFDVTCYSQPLIATVLSSHEKCYGPSFLSCSKTQNNLTE